LHIYGNIHRIIINIHCIIIKIADEGKLLFDRNARVASFEFVCCKARLLFAVPRANLIADPCDAAQKRAKSLIR